MANHSLLFLVMMLHLSLTAQGQKGPVGEAGDRGVSCGAAYSGSGVITSPNYPNNYTNNMNCTYIVTASYGEHIVLVFNSFDLETGYDFLTVSSGGLQVGRYTGSVRPPKLLLGPTVILRFTTDFSVVKSGFSIGYATIVPNCAALIVGSGLVRSPGYPQPYNDNLRCIFDLEATQGTTLSLDFQSFNIESNYDWLELYNGYSLVARYTGSTAPSRASLGQSGHIVFTTDSSVHYSGFSIAVNLAAQPCGGAISGYTSINSPNYPGNYPANVSCTWTYQARTDAVSTRLVFTAFNIENNFDFVAIYDGDTMNSLNTGAVLPPTVELRSRIIKVIFASDRSNQFTGFRLEFIPIVIH